MFTIYIPFWHSQHADQLNKLTQDGILVKQALLTLMKQLRRYSGFEGVRVSQCFFFCFLRCVLYTVTVVCFLTVSHYLLWHGRFVFE